MPEGMPEGDLNITAAFVELTDKFNLYSRNITRIDGISNNRNIHFQYGPFESAKDSNITELPTKSFCS
jgi:hypothetical protein